MNRLLSIIALIVIASLLTTNYTFGAIQTFGLTANNTFAQTNSADRKYVYSATPSSGGTVVSGVARVWNGGTVNSDTRLVIYTDTAGEPDALLAVSDTVTINTGTSESAVPYTFSGANQITIASGTPYWIGIHWSDPGTGNMSQSRANTAGLVRSDPDNFADGTSDPCACATVSNGGLDLYIEYDDTPAPGDATSTSQTIFTNSVLGNGMMR